MASAICSLWKKLQVLIFFQLAREKSCDYFLLDWIKLYIAHTNDLFCFPLSRSLINVLYIEHNNEKIEHTNEYIEHTNELQAADLNKNNLQL